MRGLIWDTFKTNCCWNHKLPESFRSPKGVELDFPQHCPISPSPPPPLSRFKCLHRDFITERYKQCISGWLQHTLGSVIGTRSTIISPNPRESYCLNIVDSLYNNEKTRCVSLLDTAKVTMEYCYHPISKLEGVLNLKNTILVYVLVWSQFMYLLSSRFSMTYFNYFGSERLVYQSVDKFVPNKAYA